MEKIPKHIRKFVELYKKGSIKKDDVLVEPAANVEDISFIINIPTFDTFGDSAGPLTYKLTVRTLVELKLRHDKEVNEALSELDAFHETVDELLTILNEINLSKKVE